jgi:hypothetical protein
MITLRRQLIETTDQDKDLFINLDLDTELMGYYSGFDRFFKGEFKITKPWTGQVNTNEKSFKIIRTRTGILRTNRSSIIVTGNEIKDGTQIKIELRFGTAWYTPISFIIGTIFFIAIATFYFQEIWGWLLVSSIWTLQILLFIVDLNKTDDRLKQYIDELRSNDPQQSHMPAWGVQ